MFKVILFVTMNFVWCSSISQQVPGSISIEEDLIKYIKNDFSDRLKIEADSFRFVIANVKIRMKLNTMTEGLLAKYCSNKFADGNTMVLNSRQLESKILDSLFCREKILDRFCNAGAQPVLNADQDSTKVYIFLSNFCENKIYAEAVNGSSIISFGGKYDIYGRAYCYLFEMENDKILYVYKSYVEYN